VNRRAFIAALGAAAWPLPLSAQPAERVRRIGVLTTIFSETDPGANAWLAAFKNELQNLGWEEGRNIRFEKRLLGSEPQQLSGIAGELAAMELDAILVAGSPALVALARVAHAVPIVFVQVLDPVKLGLITSIAKPGGNITGFTNFEDQIGGKWLGLLKDVAPATSRVAVLFDPDNPAQPVYLQGVEAAARSFDVQTARATVRDAADIRRVMTATESHPNDAFIVAPNSVTVRFRQVIIDLAAQRRIPVMYPYRFFAESGGLISYGTDLPDLWRKSATYVDRILKGTKAGDLPVQLASKFELVVNLKTAKALGLTIAEPFLQQADEVIE
jgi:putative ABC transport system substrate-binding protein